MIRSAEAHKLAAYYYNRGLEKAGVHDIDGAIVLLNRAIQLDKLFVDARNLLGLCYYQVGEAGEALAQWIISKNIKDNNPLADRYIGMFQNNPTKLSHYRLAIRKYNNALKAARKHDDDTAIILLKRAVSNNPNYVKAWQLLAVLYLKRRDYNRASKALKRSLKNDIANPRSLRLLKSIKEVRFRNADPEANLAGPTEDDMNSDIVLNGRPKQQLTPVYNYEAAKSDYGIFVSLALGILIGIIVVYWLIVPGVKQTLKQETVAKESAYGEQSAEYLSAIDSLEKEKNTLTSKLENAQMQVDSNQKEIDDLKAQKNYDNILAAYKYYCQMGTDVTKLKQYMLKNKLKLVTEAELSNANAKFLYDAMLRKYPDIMSVTVSGSELLDSGKKAYDEKKYAEAIVYLDYAYEEAPDNEEALYLLGHAYQLSDDYKNAGVYYNEYLSKFPTGKYYDTVNQYLSQIDG